MTENVSRGSRLVTPDCATRHKRGVVGAVKKACMKTGEVSSPEKTCVDRARRALRPVMDTRTFQVGERLFSQGDAPAYVFFLRSGVVSLDRAGFERGELCTAGAGDVIGVTFAISGRPYDMDARVIRTARLELVSRADFLRLMTEFPGLHLEVVRMLSLDLGRCYEVLRTLGPKTRHRVTEGASA